MRDMDLTSLPITLCAKIDESHLDMMGHMNVMWYTHLFSMAEWGLFKIVGLTDEYFTSTLAGSFALEQHFRYLKEVRLGQAISVRSRVIGRSAKRMHAMHFMTIDDTGALAATGENVMTHIDLRIRKSSPFPPEVAAAIDRLLADHSALGWAAPVCGAIKA